MVDNETGMSLGSLILYGDCVFFRCGEHVYSGRRKVVKSVSYIVVTIAHRSLP